MNVVCLSNRRWSPRNSYEPQTLTKSESLRVAGWMDALHPHDGGDISSRDLSLRSSACHVSPSSVGENGDGDPHGRMGCSMARRHYLGPSIHSRGRFTAHRSRAATGERQAEQLTAWTAGPRLEWPYRRA